MVKQVKDVRAAQYAMIGVPDSVKISILIQSISTALQIADENFTMMEARLAKLEGKDK